MAMETYAQVPWDANSPRAAARHPLVADARALEREATCEDAFALDAAALDAAHLQTKTLPECPSVGDAFDSHTKAIIRFRESAARLLCFHPGSRGAGLTVLLGRDPTLFMRAVASAASGTGVEYLAAAAAVQREEDAGI